MSADSSTESTQTLPLDWEKLYDENTRALVLYARQWSKCTADAEDAVHEAFIKVMKSDKLKELNPVPALYRASKWAALDRLRSNSRRAKREVIAHEEFDDVVRFKDPVEDRERKEVLAAAIKKLPEEQREVLVMRMWGELSFREIGESLEISLNTASSRYRYALQALKKSLTGELFHEQGAT